MLLIYGICALAARGQGDPVRADPARRVAAFARRGTDRNGAIGAGRRLPIVAIGHIKAMRRKVFSKTSMRAPRVPQS